MDKYNVQSWMEGYIQAWRSNAAEEIGSLFTAAALYYTAPYREPWRGRENIIAGWRGRQDKPDEWEFRYEILGTVNNVAFVRGWTNYHREGIKVSNLWIIRFTEGQCDEFVEWWMEER
jgi:hypothetical protein